MLLASWSQHTESNANNTATSCSMLWGQCCGVVVQALDEGLHAEADEDLADFVEAEEDEEAEEDADEDADQELEYENEDEQVGYSSTVFSSTLLSMRPDVCRTCARHMTQPYVCKELV